MNKYFPALTGLRALAAYLVFVQHFNFFKEWSGFSFIASVVDECYIGVSIFFVIIGLLTYTHYSARTGIARNFWRNYLKKRARRAYPIYFILTTVTFAAAIYLGSTGYSTTENSLLYLFNLTLLQGFFDNFKYSGIIQGWTLTVAECFYLSAPLLFVFFRPGYSWLSLVLYGLVAGAVLVLFIGKIHLLGLFGSYQFTFVYTIFGRLFEFLTGVYIGRYCRRIRKNPIKGISHTLAGAAWIVACLYLLSLVKSIFHVQQGIFHPVGILINNFILPIGIAVFVYGLIVESNWFSKLLTFTRVADRRFVGSLGDADRESGN